MGKTSRWLIRGSRLLSNLSATSALNPKIHLFYRSTVKRLPAKLLITDTLITDY
jgi:hypothetical protein